MAQSRVGLVEITQRNPAGQEFRLDIVIACGKAVLGGNFVGRAWMAVIESGAHVNSPLNPPFVQVEQKVGLKGRIEYNSDIFDAETIERLSGHFTTLLEGIVAAPQAHLSELPLLTEAEREQLLVKWNATAVDYPRDKCIHELFEAQAAVSQPVEDQRLPLAVDQIEGDLDRAVVDLVGGFCHL